MKQLAQFENPKNSAWFRAPHMYWHTRVFGAEQSDSALQWTATSPGVLSR